MADTTLQPGQIRFLQYRMPKLRSGNYGLTVTHELGATTASDTFVTDVVFSVTGERFAIDPGEVDSVFPPIGAVGEFFNVLPHLVLRRSMLPWIRSPLLKPKPPEGDEDVPGWLALLLIDQDDPQPVIAAGTVRQLVTTATTASYLDAGPDGGPADLEFDESADDPCLMLDLDYGFFRTIAPSLADLTLLSSVRVVSGQRPGTDPDAPPGGEYAVLMANRLPQTTKRSTVHLVSLESMEAYLPGAATPPAAAPATIRLVSLYQWSFDTLAEPETFAHVLKAVGLDAGLIAPPPAGIQPADDDVDRALALGYIPIDHHLRDGGRTASWYRGPLAPYHVSSTLAATLPLGSADAALRIDPATGLLDISYASAWQLGRLMALADMTFSTRLFQWKHRCARDAVEADEHRLLAARIGAEPAAGGSATDRASVVHAALSAAAGSVVSALVPNAAPLASSAPPPASADVAGMPREIELWIDRARHLHGIPFRYLVPLEAMMATETIRFFVIDPNWIAALVDGAFSIGDAVTGNLAAAGSAAATPVSAVPENAVSGFLLRSRAVKHWPGMQVLALGADGGQLTVLRYETLADDVLLCLVDGIVTKVDLHQPPEALHFGLGGDPGALTKGVRDPTKLYAFVPGQSEALPDEAALPTVPVAPQPAPAKAVAIAALAASFRTQYPHATITAAEFAMLMIEGVDHMTFDSTIPLHQDTLPLPPPPPPPDPTPIIPSHRGGPAVLPGEEDPAAAAAAAIEAAARTIQQGFRS